MAGAFRSRDGRTDRRLPIVVALLATTVVFGIAAALVEPDPLPVAATDLADMVFVEGGPFSTAGIARTVEPFWIDRFEVTEERWRRYVAETGRPIPPLDPTRTADHPVRNVSFDEAVAYSAWYFKRLPTNVEWERASLGPGGSELPWGSGYLDDAANTAEAWAAVRDQWPDVGRVGTFEAGKSACGAYDMIGNVAEWTSSAPDDLLYTLVDDAWRDEIRVARLFGERHIVVRGGSFQRRMRGRSSLETVENALTRSFEIGFRTVIAAREVELQRRLLPLLKRLGRRDPWSLLFTVPMAEDAIDAIGPAALPYLERALRGSIGAGTRARLERLITRIREKAGP